MARLLLGGETNENNPQVIMFDPVLQAKFDKIKHALGGEVVTLESNTAALDKMIVKATGPGDSGTYFLVDFAAGKVEAMGWEYPTILQADVAATRTFTYKAADGLQIEGVLTLPLGREAKNAPLVVLPHGGPLSFDYIQFDWWAQPTPPADMPSSNPTSAAPMASASPSPTPATVSGAARWRPIFPMVSPTWPARA